MDNRWAKPVATKLMSEKRPQASFSNKLDEPDADISLDFLGGETCRCQYVGGVLTHCMWSAAPLAERR
jgi:hypothetical protein